MRFALLLVLLLSIPGVIYAQSINTLIEQAEERLEHDDWIQAVKDLENIIENRIGDVTTSQKANVYNDLGYLKMRLLSPDEAEYYLNLSIITHEEVSPIDKLSYSKALQNMSQLFLQRVQFDLAKSYIDLAIDNITQEKGRENAEYALARTKLAQIYEEVGYYDLAYDIFYESHELLKSLSAFSPDYAEACNHMGRILVRRGEPEKAEEFFSESTIIYQQLGSEYEVEHAESLEGLGNFYEQLGRYEEAEKILKEALTIKRSIPNEANILIIETLNDLGILYRHLGDFDQAEIMFSQVVTECEEELSTDHPFYATAKNNLATIAMKKGKFEEAKTLLEGALDTYDKKYGINHPLSSNTLNNLARVERQLKNYDLAEAYYNRVLQLDEQLYGKEHPDYATTLINLAILYSSSEREEQARSFYKEGLAIRREVLGKNHPAYLNTLENMGLQEMASGNLMDAEGYFKEAIEIQIEQIKHTFPALSEKDQEVFYIRLREAVQRYNFIATELLESDPELITNIFDFHIKTKSILLSPREKINQRILNGNDTELRNLYFNWQRQKGLLANYYNLGTQRLLENNINLEETETEIAEIEQAIIKRMDEFKTILPELTIGWADVQKQTTENEAIVQLIKLREFKSQTNEEGIIFGFSNLTKYLAIIFTKNSAQPTYAILGGKYRAEEEHYAKYIRFLNKRDQENTSFEHLWKPVHEKIAKLGRVKVSPEGIYHKINPNVFQTEENEFVIDGYFVSYLSSCQDLFRTNSPALTKRSLLMGNPDYKMGSPNNNLGITSLPSAELEIEAISAILQPKNWNTKTYANQEASELRLRSAYSPTILHLATHGFFADNDEFISSLNTFNDMQFRSGLYLSGASNTFSSYTDGKESSKLNDGILTTQETMTLDLNRTKLVVLSSCDTNLGDVSNNESVYGLHRAFIVAGADNLLVSLSKTKDNAQSELMLLFYHKYMETENIGESLRFAQQKLRTNYEEPVVWGAFMLIGNE